MTPQRTKKIVLASVGVLVALVLTAAVISLVQRPSTSNAPTYGSTGSALGLGYRNAKVAAAPGMPPMAEEAYDASMPAPSPDYYYQSGGQTAAEVDQRIIKNGNLNLTVDKVLDAIGRISATATARGGFVQSSSSSERADGKHDGNISVRVPAKEFEATMAEIKTFAKVVNYESATGQDVTEQYTDLQAQLRNAKAQETEYLRIMTKAETVEDILRVQERLGQVRAQIEQLEGRIKYLENVTSLSTISVALTEEVLIQAPTKEFRPGAIVKEAVQTLIVLGQKLVEAAIWLVIVGGGVGLPLLVLVLIVRAMVRAAMRKRMPKP